MTQLTSLASTVEAMSRSWEQEFISTLFSQELQDDIVEASTRGPGPSVDNVAQHIVGLVKEREELEHDEIVDLKTAFFLLCEKLIPEEVQGTDQVKGMKDLYHICHLGPLE